jgi:hypothetical protein
MNRSRVVALFVAIAAALLVARVSRVVWRAAGTGGSSVPQSAKSTANAAAVSGVPGNLLATDSKRTSEHAVILHLPLSTKGFGTKHDGVACLEIEQDLEQEIVRGGVGEMDGNEIGDGECTLFMYGPDADKLFGTIASRARSSRLGKGAWAIKRYGPAEDPHAREVRVGL